MSNKRKTSKLKLVRYYIEFIFTVFIFRVFKNVNIVTASNFCGFLSRYITKWICLINGKHKMAIKNLGLCFPLKTDVQKEQIMDKFYENLGRFVGEYITQKQMTPQWIKENVEIINPEIFHQYAKIGFMGITGHFSNWELIHKYLYSEGHKLNIIYRRQNNEFVEKKFVDRRPINQIDKNSNAMKQIMNVIKEKKILGILIDQRDNLGDRFPFFGMGARTGIAIQRLSLKYNYKMICTKVLRRRDDPNKFKIIFYPPLEIKETGNLDEDIKLLTQATLNTLEEWIKEDPEQWFWIYDRWK
jgi:KDO2-lipid IV(A) lauroyltransferase